jgi:hypothetical protein
MSRPCDGSGYLAPRWVGLEDGRSTVGLAAWRVVIVSISASYALGFREQPAACGGALVHNLACGRAELSTHI